jgi:hypothetical protein
MRSATTKRGTAACLIFPRLAQVTLALLFVLLLPFAGAAPPDPRPAEKLMRLVPPDMAVVVTVEDLRGHASAFLKSRLAEEFWRLPAVRAWFASDNYQHLERARSQIERLLDANLTDVRDELLGDGVILALRLPPEAPANASLARGLLLVQARDPALLERLIRVVNTAQQESGELAEVGDRKRIGITYHVREFPAAANRPSEWYVAYPDGTFAFSNSEVLIHSVIDRKTAGAAGKDEAKAGQNDEPGLGDLSRLKAVQGRLPERALARLFVDPRHIERLLAGVPRPNEQSDPRVVATLERYLAAVDYAGAALTWNDDSIVIHTVESLNPSLLDPWLRRWAADARRADPTLEHVPPSAVAVAFGHVDGTAVLDAITQIVPERDQARLANFETLLTGLLLGQDLRAKVLPLLGPGIIAYLDAPTDADDRTTPPGSKIAPAASWPFPGVMVISLGEKSDPVVSAAAVPPKATAAAAIDNALRTVLAMVAMDETRAEGRSRIATGVIAGTSVTTLDPPIAFAYAVDRIRDRLVLSTSPAAVARYLEHAGDQNAGSSFGRSRAAAFADATSCACVDFDALGLVVAGHRDRVIRALAARQNRSIADVDRDLAHALALARLFRAGFMTSRIDADATAVQRRVGLLIHEPRAN